MNHDLTIGSPSKKLVLFAIPIILGNIFQQLYTIFDLIIVGQYVGKNALAAVGVSSTVTQLFIAIATGIGIGSSILMSQLFGAGKMGNLKTAIYTVVIAVLLLSLCLSAAGLFLNNHILRWIQTPDAVFRDAAIFLKIYFCGFLFLFLFNILNAIFNAVGESWIPLIILAVSSAINIILDLVFVRRFGMGVTGVAVATLIAQAVAAIISLLILIYKIKKMQINEEFTYFDKKILYKTCSLAIPSMIQQSFISLSILCLQSLINSFGPVIMAAYTSANKIEGIAVIPMINLGSAMSTFAAQNIAAKKPERVREGVKASLWIVIGMSVGIIILIYTIGELLIGAFADSREVIEVGSRCLREVSPFFILLGLLNIYNGVIRGAGIMSKFLLCTIVNMSLRVLSAYALAGVLGASTIWLTNGIGWLAGLLIAVIAYRSGKWKENVLV